MIESQQRFSSEETCIEHLFLLRCSRKGIVVPEVVTVLYVTIRASCISAVNASISIGVTAVAIFHEATTSLVKWHRNVQLKYVFALAVEKWVTGLSGMALFSFPERGRGYFALQSFVKVGKKQFRFLWKGRIAFDQIASPLAQFEAVAPEVHSNDGDSDGDNIIK